MLSVFHIFSFKEAEVPLISVIIGALVLAACVSVNCRSKIISRLPTLSLLRVEPHRIGVPRHSGSNGVHQGYHSQSSNAAPSTCPSVHPSDPRHRHRTLRSSLTPSSPAIAFVLSHKHPSTRAPSLSAFAFELPLPPRWNGGHTSIYL